MGRGVGRGVRGPCEHSEGSTHSTVAVVTSLVIGSRTDRQAPVPSQDPDHPTLGVFWG